MDKAFFVNQKSASITGNLTALEVSILWNQYLGDGLAICVFKYFLNTVKDKELKAHMEFALQLSQSHINEITKFFKKANFQLPMGFTEQDVNVILTKSKEM
ncbi:MAG TPA: DUF3231 family protein [Bacillota bacterium]|nr:DUF3231 family protein [Bacillota bacterium]